MSCRVRVFLVWRPHAIYDDPFVLKMTLHSQEFMATLIQDALGVTIRFKHAPGMPTVQTRRALCGSTVTASVSQNTHACMQAVQRRERVGRSFGRRGCGIIRSRSSEPGNVQQNAD
jgi:hypothetical protein